MLKNKLIVAGLLALLTFSSCGIFHKSCNCPKFGKVNVQICRYADVQMCGCANGEMCRCADGEICRYADVRMC